jgi:hypothetical protein
MALRVGGGASPNFSVAWCTASIAGANPPVVSSNGNNDAILWVTGAANPATLRAYEVSTGMEIFSDAPPSVRQWVPPVVVNGRVYVTGASTISMYRAR